jgi:hypothetical protein
MNCTVVVLEDEIPIGINSLHRRQHDVFENPSVNIASQPLFHMDHYHTAANEWKLRPSCIPKHNLDSSLNTILCHSFLHCCRSLHHSNF